MIYNIDPDGNKNWTLFNTVQEIVIPPDTEVYLKANFHANWQQSVVIYINGQRMPDTIGSYDGKRELFIESAEEERKLALAGWNRRERRRKNRKNEQKMESNPWFPSKGRRTGNVINWQDTEKDEYDDSNIIFILN